ncbi:uncharacterized protein LACBIDRAFT_296145 [Laccaria bicolor S238N-H82]|uniref:Predicted protein n=1 Tax=Laccaria bicolor (strain S238N-H82 / ATCC MYA-4686) TaxID=486041 RepID=B0E1G9_LACBS|nr:uncharacterized protein LACBIDRAFT_316708 [Laccaria bicolor S238N-H82]XP_001890543.1 uncharacterized protein LACBIDRAFT_296145 [Laccaria bicolor S238N-H82]EDQ98813.1 predicted protein [Laccaria bicolor S238N-H82]EDQ99306.1 predicted protein [Laccaria bicolor S238N-H82]|eukprot:XP_001890026.1 predicted protein [Laccaria bicolor S238N-H82]
MEVWMRQLRWKTRDSKWNGGLRRKENQRKKLEDYFAEEGPSASHNMGIKLKHPCRDFSEVSTAPASTSCRRLSARRDAGEVGHVNSDGGIRI